MFAAYADHRRRVSASPLVEIYAAVGMSRSLRRGVMMPAEATGVARWCTRTPTGWKSDAMSTVYADQREKIAASPLLDIHVTKRSW